MSQAKSTGPLLQRHYLNILSTVSIFLLIEKFAAPHSVLSPEEVEKFKTGDLPTNFYSNTYMVVLIINDSAESVGLVYETSNCQIRFQNDGKLNFVSIVVFKSYTSESTASKKKFVHQ